MEGMEPSTNQSQSLSQPQNKPQRQVIRLRIQQPPSELPPNPPQDASEADTVDKIPLTTTPAECNSPQNRRFKIYIKEDDPKPNPLRGAITMIKNGSEDLCDDDDDDEDTALEVPLSPPSFRDSDESDSDIDDNVLGANNGGNGNGNNSDDDDDDGKDEMHPVSTTNPPNGAAPPFDKPLSNAPQRLPPRPAGVGIKGSESAIGTNENIPKEEELQEFVESIVKGLVEIAHTIAPSELIGTNTNLGIGGSGSVVK